MSTPRWITLTIDIFERRGQQVKVWANLKPSELIASVLTEFGGELRYLGSDPLRYKLVRANGVSLHDGEALRDGDMLRLGENEPQQPPPTGTLPPTSAIYLRDEERGSVYPLPWLPAIIGRAARQNPEPNLVVNLGGLPTGSRVSRHHARIIQVDQAFFIESLSDNPTVIHSTNGNAIPVRDTYVAIGDGDRIVLPHSQIELLCIIRNIAERSTP